MLKLAKKFKIQKEREPEKPEETDKGEGEKIELGKRIEISVNGEFQCWDIVPPGQFNFLDKKISIDAPLIQLILDLRAGEEIRGKIGAREALVKVREVYVPSS